MKYKSLYSVKMIYLHDNLMHTKGGSVAKNYERDLLK